MCEGHIAERTRRAEVGNGGAGSLRQHIVGHSHKRVFLDKHLAVFHHDGETVHVGVDHETHIGAALFHERCDLSEIFGNRLGGVGETSVGLAIELDDILHAESAEQLRDDNTANGIDSVDSHSKVSVDNRLTVNEVEGKHLLDVATVVGIVGEFMSKIGHFGKAVVIGSGNAEHLFAFGVVEKLAVVIEKLQSVPLCGIMAGRDDDAAVGFLTGDGDLRGGRRSEADVDHIKAHGAKRGDDDAAHHAARETGVASNDNHIGSDRRILAYERCVGSREFDDVDRRKAF